MSTVIKMEHSADFLDDRHLIVGEKVCIVRQLPLAATWKYATIAMQYAFWADPALDTTPATVANIELWFGFCKSGANHPGVIPATNMDTCIGLRWGNVGGTYFGAGETFTGANYSNGDWYYQPSGHRLVSVLNGVITSRGSNANGICTKAFRQYSSCRSQCFIAIEDQGSNWNVTTWFPYPGGGTFNSGLPYSLLLKAVQHGLRIGGGLAPQFNDGGWQPRNFINATFAKDDTRGRPDAMFILFRDHNATGAQFVLSGIAARTN